MSEPTWQDVDQYLSSTLHVEDEAMRRIRDATHAAGLPAIEVSPTQGRLLNLLCRMVGAHRVLEFGTLGGYSTTWLARAVGDDGRVVTLELERRHADVARSNLEDAGVGGRVDIVVGPALESVHSLIANGTQPFDMVFIDADKPNNVGYLEASLALSHPGTLIVVDNVVRGGRVADPAATDGGVIGSRAVLDALGAHPRLDVTAIQTVGSKGWDGLAIALVR